jgi:hypothetical protein
MENEVFYIIHMKRLERTTDWLELPRLNDFLQQ